MSIVSFKDKASEDLSYGRSSKVALRRLPKELHSKVQVKMARIGAATSLEDLRELRGNSLEALRRDRKGQYSIRINDQYRICFEWKEQQAYEVEVVDYHS